MRKKRLSLLLILVMVATMLAGLRTEPVSAASMRDVTAQQVVDAIDFGWNLGNDLDCFEQNAGGYKGSPQAYERLWGNPPATKAMIDKVKETGINAIRIPVTWYHNMEGNNIRSNWLSRVKEVVDYAIDNNTYVIINVHHDTGVHGWLKATTNNAYRNEQKFVKIWEQVAQYFRNYDEHLLFEGYNEIIDNSDNWNDTSYENYQECNKLNQLFVDTVRKSGGNNSKRVLITNTYAAAVQTGELNNFKKPTDTVANKLIAEVHCYTPYKFCFKDYPDTGYGSDYDVYEFMDRTVNRFKSLGMPVIIGEFGAVDKGNTGTRVKWADIYTKNAAQRGIKCFLWDDGGDFKMLNRNGLSWYYPDVLKVMLKNYGITWNGYGRGTKTNPTSTPRPTNTPRPTATPTPQPWRPTATPTPQPWRPTATPTPQPWRPTATPTPQPWRPTATPTPQPWRPTATPAPQDGHERNEDGTYVGAEIDASKIYMIQNVNSGKYLDAAGQNVQGGINVQQWDSSTENPGINQTWIVKKVNWGYYYIYSRLGDGSSLVLNVNDGNNGSNINLDFRNGQSTQYFKFVPNQDGTYEIVTRASRDRSCVEIINAYTDNGANVQQYQWNNHPCQRWRLIPVGDRQGVTPAPKPTATPEPTAAPRPTSTPQPTVTPRPTSTPKPAPTQEGTGHRRLRYHRIDLDGEPILP